MPLIKNKIKNIIIPLAVIFLSIVIALFAVTFFTGKTVHIGIINPNPGLKDVVEGFKSELAGLGYVEGKNTTYSYVHQMSDIAPAVRNFRKNKIDLVLTLTTPATLAAQKAMEGAKVPIVFGASYDPVKGGIVKDLLRHEENITGIKVGGSTQKAFEWLLETAPKIKRIFVPVKFDTEAASLSLDELKQAAKKNKTDIIVSNVNTVQDLNAALSSMPENVDAIFVLNSIFIVSNIDMIVEAAIERRLPTGAGSGQYKNGVTITYGQDHRRSGEQAAGLAREILQGTPASSLPVETAGYYLGINLKTAEAIGLKISNDILVQADFVVHQ